MGTVKSTLSTSDHSLSEETIAELIALENRPINTKDIPERTREEMLLGKQMAMAKRRKQMFSLRLQPSTIEWWRENIGGGYTGVMSRLLDEATKRPDWIKECL
jgi:hypothetical protein